MPYYAYSGLNYDVNGKNKRESYYAQDAWKKGRLTVNLGLRLDRIRGDSLSLDKNVYAPDLALGPRIGGVFDLTGSRDQRHPRLLGTVFRGHVAQPVRQCGRRLRGLRLLRGHRRQVRGVRPQPAR